MTKPIRIGNAQAFWGDRSDAAAELLAAEPGLDYITLDYLAEVSMSILAQQRERDPRAGYARDIVDVIRSLAPYWAAGGKCRLISNAGGLNPRACAEACRAALAECGCPPIRIGVITGDDVMELLAVAADDSRLDYANLDSGAAISIVRDRLVTANAYLGAEPMVEALAAGAEIVITGRVADPSLVVAACRHHFGWSKLEFDRLAGATVAGHLIECGTQVTGGISTDWLEVPDTAGLGFPIVEVSGDGSCVVTKPAGAGGQVSSMTVKEQLVYEVGDPAEYLSPDVAVSFLALKVADLGGDRVRVSGATGQAPPATYKVSATYRDGFRAAGTLVIIGRDSAAKARRCGEIVLERVGAAGFVLRDSLVECLGSGDASNGIVKQNGEPSAQFGETVLRIAVESDSREAVERFTRELMPLITAGPQGTTGYAEGRPRVHSVFRYWPCLVNRDAVRPRVELLPGDTVVGAASSGAVPKPFRPRLPVSPGAASAAHAKRTVSSGRLYDLACARSGDKGTGANVGVIARNREAWHWLRNWLTADCVAEYFSPLGIESVERYELPNLEALNFVLRGALRRGLRTDAQGKSLGQLLLEMPIPESVA